MPRVLTDEEMDPAGQAVDDMLVAEEEAVLWQGAEAGSQVRIMPMSNGSPQQGRAVARRVWMWNGTESLVPLGWNPNGTIHDNARPYLLKRHCLCCQTGGFRGRCPKCIKSNCTNCRGGTDKKQNIACFYVRKEEVPFPMRFYGPIDCFLETCPRRGGRGFKTEPDMRFHARTRHKLEYQGHIETIEANKRDEIEALRGRLDSLQSGANVRRVVDSEDADWQDYLAWKKYSARQEDRAHNKALKTKASKPRASRKPIAAPPVASDHPVERPVEG